MTKSRRCASLPHRRSGRSASGVVWWAARLGLGGCLVGLATACSTTRTTEPRITMESPRTTGGVVFEETSDEGLARIRSALDELEATPAAASVMALLEDEAAASRDEAVQRLSEAIARSSIGGSAPAGTLPVPPAAGRLLPLSKLSRFEVGELMTSLGLRLQTELGYRPAGPERAGLFAPPPEGVSPGPVLTRDDPESAFSLLRLGSVRYASQPPQLWAQGVVVGAGGTISASGDLDTLPAAVESSLQQIAQMRGEMNNADLERQIVRLSYTSTPAAINALKGMGVNTVPSIEAVPGKIPFDQLPLVTQMPAPASNDTGLLGDKQIQRGQFGVSVATNAADLPPNVDAGPSSQLMVLFHPAHPEQLSMVRSLLNDFVDRPAQLIFVEGMVLEISETGLEELGVEWEFKEGPIDLTLGSLDPTVIRDTLSFDRLDSRDLTRDWRLRIQALVTEGKAEVLSRPSVLTMDNRQASIRVGEDIPIATSQEGTLNANKIAFNFQYIPTGILLNIRPRVTDQGDEISMLVDTIVSATVPGRDLEVRSADGDLLASAPTISTRRVQTYARIDNKTPFIIGGLVSRNQTVTNQKVPLLGDIPILGEAFKSSRTSSERREVIIVLTPYVLPEENRIVTRTMPRDEDLFDSTGNRLFRDAYRIRGDDVFDLRFIADNRRLSLYRKLAREAIGTNFRLASTEPFSAFAENEIPGEELLVQRMIYELIKRTRVDERVNTDRMIFFEEAQSEGYKVRFLSELLGTGPKGAAAVFAANPGKAIAMTFRSHKESGDVSRLASEPIPEVSLIDCPDRKTWTDLLWELNQPLPDGTEQHTILLMDERDVQRVRRAIMMKLVILLNADDEALNLKSFKIGKIIHVPAMDDSKVTVLDAEVARYFFVSELYYSALIQRIETTLTALDRVLRDPEIQTYLADPAEVPPPGGR